MTIQTLISQPSSQSSVIKEALSQEAFPSGTRIVKSVQTHYQSNHQAEFLDITAQIESLLEELQTLQQR